MKKCLLLLLCMVLCVCMVTAGAETLEITGRWTYDIDLAEWFEYKGGDVDAKVAYEWKFEADGTFVQQYADKTKVSAVVKELMTKILTTEIAAEGVTIDTVATAEGFASVDAFVESIIQKEKLDTLGEAVTSGTYTVEDNVLKMYFTDDEGKLVEAVDTMTLDGDNLTLVGVENETITLTRYKEEVVVN